MISVASGCHATEGEVAGADFILTALYCQSLGSLTKHVQFQIANGHQTFRVRLKNIFL